MELAFGLVYTIVAPLPLPTKFIPRQLLPLDVQPESLLLWHHCDFQTAVVKDAMDRVSLWKDFSGNNHHSIQTVGTLQPTWTEGLIGVKAGLAFNGVNSLCLSADVASPRVLAVEDGNATVFAVCRTNINGRKQRIINFTKAGAAKSYMSYFAGSDVSRFFYGGAANSTVATDNTDWTLFSCSRDLVNLEMILNGLITENIEGNDITLEAGTIGSHRERNFFLDGHLIELLVYGVNLSDESKDILTYQYFAPKYALTVA